MAVICRSTFIAVLLAVTVAVHGQDTARTALAFSLKEAKASPAVCTAAMEVPQEEGSWALRGATEELGVIYGISVKSFREGQAALSRSEKTTMLQLQATNQILKLKVRQDKYYKNLLFAFQMKVDYPDALPDLIMSIEGNLGKGVEYYYGYYEDSVACVAVAKAQSIEVKRVVYLSDSEVWNAYQAAVLHKAKQLLDEGDAQGAVKCLFSLKKMGMESKLLYTILHDAYLMENLIAEADRISNYILERFSDPAVQPSLPERSAPEETQSVQDDSIIQLKPVI